MQDRPLPGVSLLARLNAEDRKALLALGTLRDFAPRSTLIREGGPERDVYLLLSGSVKVVGYTADGRATVLSVRLAGDLVGELAALDDRPRSATVEAVTAVRAQVVGQRDFRALYDQRRTVRDAVEGRIMAKLREATRTRSTLGAARTELQVAGMVLLLAEAYGRPLADGHLVDTPLTQADVAGLIGSSRASVERAVRRLRAAGLLIWRRRRFVVPDLGALRRHVENGE